MQNSSFRFGCASVSLIEYTCDFLLLHPQVHVTSQAKDASFKQIIIEYNHLFDWLGRSSITHKRGKSFFSTPIIKNPPAIKMKVSGASISIQNGVDYHKGENIEYCQKAWVKINNPQKLTINEWLENFVDPIRHLLTLAINSATQLTSFKLSLVGQRKIDKTSKNTYVTVFINGLKAANDIPKTTLSSHEIIFSYQYIIRANASKFIFKN